MHTLSLCYTRAHAYFSPMEIYQRVFRIFGVGAGQGCGAATQGKTSHFRICELTTTLSFTNTSLTTTLPFIGNSPSHRYLFHTITVITSIIFTTSSATITIITVAVTIITAITTTPPYQVVPEPKNMATLVESMQVGNCMSVCVIL